MDFMQFIDAVVNARFGFPEMFGGLATFFATLCADANILTIWDFLMQCISLLLPAMPFILLAFYIILGTLGKRLFSILRFLAFFVVGFALGVYFLAPLILVVIQALPPWVVGVVIGVIAAVLSKILYFVVLAVTVGYCGYVLMFQGLIIPGFMEGNYWVALLFAVVLTVLVLLFRKYVEMAGTSFLGGLGIAYVIRGWWDFTALDFLVGIEWLGILVVALVFAVLGFIVQFKTRVRY